jgi:hypothetical protein
MILHHRTQQPIMSLVKLKEDALWLRDFLHQNNIQIEEDSILDLALYDSENLPNWSNDLKKYHNNPKKQNARDVYL